MVSIDIKNVSGEILQEAERRAAEIKAESSHERERILEEVRREIGERKQEMEREAERTITQLHASDMTKARMRSKELVQAARMNAIEEVYERFYGSLSDVEMLLNALYDTGKKSSKDIGTVYVSERDLAAAKKLFRHERVAASPIKGGLVLESKDGRELVNLSMEVLRELLEARTFPTVYRLVFGEK